MNRRVLVLVVSLIVAAALLTGEIWYYTAHQSVSSQPQTQDTATATTTNAAGATTAELDKYGLFVQAKLAQDIGEDPYKPVQIDYEDGGTITSGPYVGYHRLLVNVPYDGMAWIREDPLLVFATKDYKTYILGHDNFYYTATSSVFNKDKVAGSGDVPRTNAPAIIPLGNFALVRDQIYTGDIPSSTMITSLVPGLKFYFDPNWQGGRPLDAYIEDFSEVIVKDPAGPAAFYSLVSREELARANNDIHALDTVFYKRAELASSLPIYQSYGMVLPGGCGAGLDTLVLKNIQQSDLVRVSATLQGTDIYALKNSEHALNRGQYAAKITVLAYPDETSMHDYSGNPLPSYEEYLAKTPVLIVKDPWGRWLGLGEFDYELPGGCGKPVIYLYPEKPTAVTVKFQTPMLLSIDIPTYSGGWKILANPNGQLTDLQPALTDCDKIDYNLDGSEYAQDACAKKVYPYLYWAGQAARKYPTADGGWIVEKNNLQAFLGDKLAEIGLNQNEKNDMLQYWVPELLKKNVPYYRISFFQTEQMNQFIPMQVTPRPDTVFRIFLDWSPLGEMPSAPLRPETLNHLDRHGFTLVEWGGLKQ